MVMRNMMFTRGDIMYRLLKINFCLFLLLFIEVGNATQNNIFPADIPPVKYNDLSSKEKGDILCNIAESSCEILLKSTRAWFTSFEGFY